MESRGALPDWYSAALSVLVAAIAAAGASGLLLLWLGHYEPLLCFVGAVLGGGAACFARARPEPQRPPAHLAAAAAVALTLVALVLGIAFHSEHLFTDRDPAVYLNAGRSIARTHELVTQTTPGAFANRDAFSQGAAGFLTDAHGTRPNFLNFLSVIEALAWSIGHDTALVVAPPVLGALALLALYALTLEVVGPWWALLPSAILTLAPLQSWFSRDAYSELAVELLALTGVWLLVNALRRGAAATGLLSGLLLGATVLARVDSPALFVGLPVLVAVMYLRGQELPEAARRARARTLWWFAGALVAAAAIAQLLSLRVSFGYVKFNWSSLRGLIAATAASVVASALAVAAHRVRPGIGRGLARSGIALIVAVVAFVAVVLYAALGRPEPLSQRPVPGAAGATTAFRNAYDAWHWSYSFRWFGWYLGPIAVALACIGLIVLGVRALQGSTVASVVVAAALPVTILYVARPSITPDHLWVMRRYLPMVLPAVAIAIAAALSWLTRLTRRRFGGWSALVAGAGLLAVLVPATAAGASIPRARVQAGALAAVHTLCRNAGPDAAIAVVPTSNLGIIAPQTLRGFCGVPVAALNRATDPNVGEYASEWRRDGRTLYLAAASPELATGLAPGARPVAHVIVDDRFDPARTLTSRPRGYQPVPIEIWLYEVPTR